MGWCWQVRFDDPAAAEVLRLMAEEGLSFRKAAERAGLPRVVDEPWRETFRPRRVFRRGSGRGKRN